MMWRPPRAKRTDTRFPYTTPFRSEYGAIGRPPRQRGITPRQQPHMCSDGRHYRPAIGRIAQPQRVAEMRVDLSSSRHRGERRPPLDLGIMKRGLIRGAAVGEGYAKGRPVLYVPRVRVSGKAKIGREPYGGREG